ncbi:MAG: SAM-dependent chlorinase/fluorinase [Bacteroidales bacterium]|jgi:S-adenosyl-L-methionine hydrolase (adenosine-forming)|nr:SAM-dependent chlorinase/fluorinase [Bacteroidales bacterium]
MPVVTVTSDWNKHDFYAGVLEGGLLGIAPVYQITHQIHPFDVRMGVFVLRQAYNRYPSGSIHILAVQAQATDQLPMSVAYYQEHYFITVNDGRFSLLFDHEPQWIRAVYAAQGTFSELDAYIKAVKAIVEDKLGEMTLPADMKTEVRPSAVAEKDYIMGQVIYIDSYGNAITNVSRSLFNKVGAGRDFRIFLQGPYNRIEKISDSYGGVRPGQLLALFNSADLLELAVFMGSLATLENIGLYDDIQIQFSKYG